MLLSLQNIKKLARTGRPLHIRTVTTDEYTWRLEFPDDEPINRISAPSLEQLTQTLALRLGHHPDEVTIDGVTVAKQAPPVPAAATAYRREEAGYRYHSIPWPTEPDTPPVSIELGIMAGGLLVQAAGAGTTHFRFSQPGPSLHWSEAWQMQVQPQLTLTSEELDTLSENEFKALVDTGQGPDRLRKQLIQRASEQRLRTTRNGLLPQPCNSPIFPKVISSPEMDGLPYGQGPNIFVHGNPVRITGPKDQ